MRISEIIEGLTPINRTWQSLSNSSIQLPPRFQETVDLMSLLIKFRKNQNVTQVLVSRFDTKINEYVKCIQTLETFPDQQDPDLVKRLTSAVSQLQHLQTLRAQITP